MNYIESMPALAFSIALVSFSAMAKAMPTAIKCNSKAVPAELSVKAEAWTSVDDQAKPSCPLLKEKALRKLVNKFGEGSTFAHPLIPGSCLSGTVTSGTLRLDDGSEIKIDPTVSYSESAQRLFPVPTGQGGVNLFETSLDETFQAGAAMTAVHLEGEDSQGGVYKLNLLLDDHFMITPTGEDTEDFLIVGSKGDYKVSGRLTGKGQIVSEQPLGILFEITGTVCLR